MLFKLIQNREKLGIAEVEQTTDDPVRGIQAHRRIAKGQVIQTAVGDRGFNRLYVMGADGVIDLARFERAVNKNWKHGRRG